MNAFVLTREINRNRIASIEIGEIKFDALVDTIDFDHRYPFHPEEITLKVKVMNDKMVRYGSNSPSNQFEIKKVIFNDPATIVYWADDTKTVVKTQNGEPFDPEKGLAMAFTKKVLGNKGSYFNEVKKHVKPYEDDCKKAAETFKETLARMAYQCAKPSEELKKLYGELKKSFGNEDLPANAKN